MKKYLLSSKFAFGKVFAIISTVLMNDYMNRIFSIVMTVFLCLLALMPRDRRRAMFSEES